MYHFYFDYNGETIDLPVNPDKLTTKVGNKNKTIDLISIGEANLLKEVGLQDFSFKILLPGRELHFVHNIGEFKPPVFYQDKFYFYKTEKKPVRFIIERVLPNGEEIFGTNILVSFEDYSIDESAGEEGDFYVNIKLKEYRPIRSKIIEVEGTDPDTGKTLVTETAQQETKEPAKQYKVVAGDSLWAIAKRELNDGSSYMEIAELNGIKDPSKIYPGQVLKLA